MQQPGVLASAVVIAVFCMLTRIGGGYRYDSSAAEEAAAAVAEAAAAASRRAGSPSVEGLPQYDIPPGADPDDAAVLADPRGYSKMVDTIDLLERLQKLNVGFGKYLSMVNREKQQSLPELGKFRDTALLSEKKRQAAQSGAQICIWKVCPPSPWRRAGRPHAGYR